MSALTCGPMTTRYQREAHRATFTSRYAQEPSKRPGAKGLRLGDLLKIVANYGEESFFLETEKGEFCVIDTATKQKAWFEYPIGAMPDHITAMVRSHFDAPAFRADARLWIV